jgi:hypothetical protein
MGGLQVGEALRESVQMDSRVPLGSRLNKQHLNVDKLMGLELKTVRGQTDPTRY